MPPTVEFRHSGFADVLRHGPPMADRVAGSRSLARWQLLTRTVCHGLGRVELAGMDNLPEHGPLIVAVNHTSAMDGALLFAFLGRTISFLVKAEAFEPLHGVAGRVLIRNAQLPVRRHRIDPAPVRLSLRLLCSGGVLGICPEGRRGDGLVGQARPGVGYFAVKSGAPVLPVAVHGAATMVPGRGWRRPPVRIVFGPPIRLAAAGPGPVNRRVWLAATEQIRAELAALVRDTAHRSP
ncbi:MAG TPA: lysophospholipid acyltransferase family protein [Jatrophihabitans sp.]|nr:lysophospholipid acyltransferase family protein [Jatrophihabitans sp.]